MTCFERCAILREKRRKGGKREGVDWACLWAALTRRASQGFTSPRFWPTRHCTNVIFGGRVLDLCFWNYSPVLGMNATCHSACWSAVWYLSKTHPPCLLYYSMIYLTLHCCSGITNKSLPDIAALVYVANLCGIVSYSVTFLWPLFCSSD